MLHIRKKKHLKVQKHKKRLQYFNHHGDLDLQKGSFQIQLHINNAVNVKTKTGQIKCQSCTRTCETWISIIGTRKEKSF